MSYDRCESSYYWSRKREAEQGKKACELNRASWRSVVPIEEEEEEEESRRVCVSLSLCK